jgi:1-phosphofructokinase family hexose kinase
MITTLTPSPSIDLDYSLNSLQLGGVNRARAFSFHAGGKGVNVSRVLTLMKVNNVAMVPMAKANGDFFISAAEAEKLKLEIMPIGSPLRLNVSLVHEGLTTKVNAESSPWTDAEAKKIAGRFKMRVRRSEFGVIGGSLPAGLDPEWIAKLVADNSNRTKVVVDCSGDVLKAAIAAKPFLIKPNQDEAAQLIGSAIVTLGDAIDACFELHALGAKNILLSLGEHGSIFYNGQMLYRAKAQNIVATNTVGAGDSLLAGFIGKFKAGPVKALASGVAWSTAAITSRGTGITNPPTIFPTELISEIDPKEASLREEQLQN